MRMINIDCLDNDLSDVLDTSFSVHNNLTVVTNTLLLQLVRDVQRLTQAVERLHDADRPQTQ